MNKKMQQEEERILKKLMNNTYNEIESIKEKIDVILKNKLEYRSKKNSLLFSFLYNCFEYISVFGGIGLISLFSCKLLIDNPLLLEKTINIIINLASFLTGFSVLISAAINLDLYHDLKVEHKNSDEEDLEELKNILAEKKDYIKVLEKDLQISQNRVIKDDDYLNNKVLENIKDNEVVKEEKPVQKVYKRY